ncbi:MAG TPA: universal stress protein, partial [Syntrophobacteria bacterium]|nr:universal stress protein [Syntrophobacteria bacterium]
MKILFAGDPYPYSAFALSEVIRLATNTWADVTLLAASPSLSARGSEGTTSLPSRHPLSESLQQYREMFLKTAQDKGSPYARETWQYEWLPLKDGRWEELLVCRGVKKDLRVRLRGGEPAQEILAEAREDESDLIVLGCTKGKECVWEGAAQVPQRVVNDAGCSVLLVKEEQPITRILACLDQSYISQDSLEIINQMVTIHGARLELIGLGQGGGDMKRDVYRRLIEIGDYYEDRQIKVTTRLTEVSEFENLIMTELKEDLLALWMGRKALLNRF